MNAAATAIEYKTLSGTSNQINVTNGVGSITLSTPQNIHTGASPTFAGLSLSTTPLGVSSGGTGLSSITANNLIYGNGTSAASLLAPDAVTGKLLMNTASGAPSWSTLTALPSTAGILPLANGGMNASLTASNGGIFYSTGSAGAILAGTATAGQILRSGTNAAPSWSTATYPSTVTTGDVLIATGTNAIGSLADVATGSVLTSGGVGTAPAWGYPALTTAETYISSSVTLTAGSASSAIATVSLAAGTWLITSDITLYYDIGSTYCTATAVLGTAYNTAYTSGEAETRINTLAPYGGIHMNLSKIITLGSTTSVSLYVESNVAMVVEATCVDYPSTANTATGIHAVRIK